DRRVKLNVGGGIFACLLVEAVVIKPIEDCLQSVDVSLRSIERRFARGETFKLNADLQPVKVVTFRRRRQKCALMRFEREDAVLPQPQERLTHRRTGK